MDAFDKTINYLFKSESETWTLQGPEEERQACLSGDPSDSGCIYLYYIAVTEIYYYYYYYE